MRKDEEVKFTDDKKMNFLYVMQGKLEITFELVHSEIREREPVEIPLGGYIDPLKITEFCTGTDIERCTQEYKA